MELWKHVDGGGRSIITREKGQSKLSYPGTPLSARQEGSVAALLYSTQMNDGWTLLLGPLICPLIISETDQGKAIPFWQKELTDFSVLNTAFYFGDLAQEYHLLTPFLLAQ